MNKQCRISLLEMNNWIIIVLKRSFGASRKPRLDFVFYQVKKHLLLVLLGYDYFRIHQKRNRITDFSAMQRCLL